MYIYIYKIFAVIVFSNHLPIVLWSWSNVWAAATLTSSRGSQRAFLTVGTTLSTYAKTWPRKTRKCRQTLKWLTWNTHTDMISLINHCGQLDLSNLCAGQIKKINGILIINSNRTLGTSVVRCLFLSVIRNDSLCRNIQNSCRRGKCPGWYSYSHNALRHTFFRLRALANH